MALTNNKRARFYLQCAEMECAKITKGRLYLWDNRKGYFAEYYPELGLFQENESVRNMETNERSQIIILALLFSYWMIKLK